MEEKKLLHIIRKSRIAFSILLTFLSCHLYAFNGDVSHDFDNDINRLKENAKILSEKYIQDGSLNQFKETEKKIIEGIKSSNKQEFDLRSSLSKDKEIIYIFVSLSIPKMNLINLASEAKRLNDSQEYKIALVLRGLKEGSYKKTALYLQEIISKSDIGMIIDPTLFERYSIDVVPTFVTLRKQIICPPNKSCPTGKYNKISGNITLDYAINQMREKRGYL